MMTMMADDVEDHDNDHDDDNDDGHYDHLISCQLSSCTFFHVLFSCLD